MEQEYSEKDKYFIMGKNRILITEHFKPDGKPLDSILEKMILEAGNKGPGNKP